MELGFIVFVGLVILLIYGLIVPLFVDNKRVEAWQAFANSYDLTMIDKGLFTKKPVVYGDYQGHHLHLETINDPDTLKTRMHLDRGESTRDPMPLEEVEAALKQIPRTSWFLSTDSDGQTITYTKNRFQYDVPQLRQAFRQLCYLADLYPHAVAQGTALMPLLREIADREVQPQLARLALAMMKDIAHETQERLMPHAELLYCKVCLTKCGPHDIQSNFFDFATFQATQFYGCRLCEQDRHFYHVEGHVIAILDAEMVGDVILEHGVLRVNWLRERNLFDFDTVKIIHATDEEVERFAVQVGNDTDPYRRPRYKSMTCTVAASANLSENTLRILKRTFGTVEII